MKYKGFDINVRVAGTYSNLYALNEDGTWGENYDIIIFNNDEEVVWYEHDDMHLPMDYDAELGFKTLEKCKQEIDKYVKANATKGEK